ncbi:MAG TPA: alpha/beta fold hydrolase [Candidatus Thermoplasmatota archaeon]|jgi:pimeloyl-ACP methyl ester carboxylesterase|nr:alpha/beta fold hydrolase [Candidatus Thermoplasmatota archaeon]
MSRALPAALLVGVLLAVAVAPGAPSAAPGPRDAGLRSEHDVDVGGGVTLHVVEVAPAAPRTPARAVLFVPATLVDHRQWDADVTEDGSYNGLLRAAALGFDAYAFDWEGYGQSSHPANGLDVTAERLVPEAGALLEWVRARSGAERVDMVAASLGDSIAVALGGVASPIDAAHVGKLALTSNVYANPSPAILVLTGPGACFAMEHSPNGYMDTVAPMYMPILWTATLEAQLYAYQTFPGTYAAGPTHEGCDLPVFPASEGRAPARVFYGTLDLITNEADVQAFCAEYGGPCELDLVEGAGHAPNFEPIRNTFWEHVFDFFG